MGSLIAPLPAARAEPSHEVSPERFLYQTYGIERLGNTWITQRERKLRKKLAELTPLHRKIVAIDQHLQRMADLNAVAWQQRQQLERIVQQLAAKKGRVPANSPQWKSIKRTLQAQQKELKQLRRVALSPHAFAESPRVRKLVIQQANLHNRMTLLILAIYQGVPALTKEYRLLAKDAKVTTAIAQLGKPNHLGPVRSYEKDRDHLPMYGKLVFTSAVPLYRENGRLRVSLIVNERTPVTFTWRSSRGPTIVTAGMIQALGLSVPPNARRVQLDVGGNCQLSLQEMTIPCIRMGKHVIRQVPVFVLPPEGEHLGSRIGIDAWPNHQIDPLPEQLQLRIKALPK